MYDFCIAAYGSTHNAYVFGCLKHKQLNINGLGSYEILLFMRTSTRNFTFFGVERRTFLYSKASVNADFKMGKTKSCSFDQCSFFKLVLYA